MRGPANDQSQLHGAGDVFILVTPQTLHMLTSMTCPSIQGLRQPVGGVCGPDTAGGSAAAVDDGGRQPRAGLA